MPRNLGKFEVIATGYKKGGGDGTKQTAVQTVISRHDHYSHAHAYLTRHLGAEKMGRGSTGQFSKDGLVFHIQPVFPKNKKGQKMQTESKEVVFIPNTRVRIIREAIAKAKEKSKSSGNTLTGKKADRVNTEPKLNSLRSPSGSVIKTDPSV